jgi:hypothetical protein
MNFYLTVLKICLNTRQYGIDLNHKPCRTLHLGLFHLCMPVVWIFNNVEASRFGEYPWPCTIFTDTEFLHVHNKLEKWPKSKKQRKD